MKLTIIEAIEHLKSINRKHSRGPDDEYCRGYANALDTLREAIENGEVSNG